MFIQLSVAIFALATSLYLEHRRSYPPTLFALVSPMLLCFRFHIRVIPHSTLSVCLPPMNIMGSGCVSAVANASVPSFLEAE